jgi:branched-chain amino acid transport system substrate-binding protein
MASVGVIAATACSAEEAAPPTTAAPAPTTTVAEPVTADGQLTIGIMLPADDTVFGAPLSSAALLAIERINAAGGVLGRPVRSIVVDEGETAAATTESIQTLIESGADAIVGPASSLTALSALEQIVGSGTVACSPTASAMSLDAFPDDGLFFRTIPSDSLQARAIAEAAIQTGALGATIVHVDDGYGRSLAEAVTAVLVAGGMDLGDPIPFGTRDTDLSAEAQLLIDSGSNVAIVLANQNDGTRFLTALDMLDTRRVDAIIVNGAMRGPTQPQRIAALSNQLRSRIIGIAPQAEAADPAAPFDPPGPFATNAYDCVNLLALAAVRAGSDAPRAIAEQIGPVSSSGSACSTFAECAEAIEDGLQVDYGGPTGLVEISARQGDPSRAVFDRFRFGSDGVDRLDRKVVVG